MALSYSILLHRLGYLPDTLSLDGFCKSEAHSVFFLKPSPDIAMTLRFHRKAFDFTKDLGNIVTLQVQLGRIVKQLLLK